MFTSKKRVNIVDSAGEHTAVDVETLPEGKSLPFDVFIRDKGIFKPLFEKGMPFNLTAKDVLKEKGISEVYIRGRDIEENETYFSEAKSEKSSFYDDPAVFKKYSFYKGRYHQIDRAALIPGGEIRFGLYKLDKTYFSPLVAARIEEPARIPESTQTVRGDIVINKADIPLYYEYLGFLATSESISPYDKLKVKPVAVKEKDKSAMPEFFDGSAVDIRIRGMETKEKAKILVRDILDNPKNGGKIRELKGSINEMMECIMENRDAIYGLLSFEGHDYYTYTHSVNVAALSVGLGIDLGLKRDDVEKLGLGAILHDIGESAIPPEIVYKQGNLNDAEYLVLRNHVLEGERILRSHKEFPEESFPAVLQHHEKLSGKGYPYQLSGNEIKTFGRITAIADCFDALTTRRPFKPALAPYYALSVIAKETENYDHKFLKIFIKILGKIG